MRLDFKTGPTLLAEKPLPRKGRVKVCGHSPGWGSFRCIQAPGHEGSHRGLVAMGPESTMVDCWWAA